MDPQHPIINAHALAAWQFGPFQHVTTRIPAYRMADSSQDQDQAYCRSSGQLRLLEIGTSLRLTFLEMRTQRVHELFLPLFSLLLHN